ncbi:MAG: prepilin peptidase, partial [Candidatus Omnitrophica bacterium]|nr:prepilin peptidase [Candidatus Omnitrophota bacterium]
MIEAILFLFGAVVGSFLNVCVHRMPREESIVRPGSHCPGCRQKIPWYDNIPLVSFIILQGKCRFCGGKISWRYPFVELLAGLAPVWVVTQRGTGIETVIITVLLWALIVVTFVDLEHQVIPDEITLGGLFLAVVVSIADPGIHGAENWSEGLRGAVMGAAVGAGSLYLVGWLGKLIFKREA